MGRFWGKEDPPPARVKPAPITLVLYLINFAHSRIVVDGRSPPANAERAWADMICIAFYFLLRPSEYAGVDGEHASFTLDDVHLYVGSRKLCIATALERDICNATTMRLHFTTQKNQRRGDLIAHTRSRHPYCCPVLATIRMILTHRRWFAQAGEPFDGTVRLASFYHRNQRVNIRSSDLTAQLRFAARECFHATGISPKDITARSLRAGGAMALLCGEVDKNTIQLLGRWYSDSMLRYLHQEAKPITDNLAVKMFNGGSYEFLPTAIIPSLA